jgi:hypothetical protein
MSSGPLLNQRPIRQRNSEEDKLHLAAATLSLGFPSLPPLWTGTASSTRIVR